MKLGIIKGKVWKFGDNINTTDITPYELFDQNLEDAKKRVFAAIRPEWKNKVKPGDCIIAGDNFGFGSSRPSANEVMIDLEIGCLIANSIARVYYRTAIDLGFLAFQCPDVSKIFEEGDILEFDVDNGLIKNLTTGDSINGKQYPPYIIEILENGGLLPMLLNKIKEKESGFFEN